MTSPRNPPSSILRTKTRLVIRSVFIARCFLSDMGAQQSSDFARRCFPLDAK